MQEIEVSQITVGSNAYKQAYQLREKLLRQPIGLSLDDEDLSDEVNDFLLAAIDKDTVVGCLILSPKEKGKIQLRQMAVSDTLQGKGIGRVLVSAAETIAWENGYTTIILHARVVAKGFYDRLDYTQVGDVFTEVGIPHVVMEKKKIETL